MSEPINGWTPPTISYRENFEPRSRVVTQAGVDNWIEIARKYYALLAVVSQAREMIADFSRDA